jgi:hypothetical protein
MAQPVWSLSVNLETKTATFQSGMADAAKSARASFGDIRESANGMADDVGSATRSMGGHMSEARHGVMMLGEEFGVHLPRGITTFLASIGPVGAAMEAAFPYLAIILGATLLIEHIMKLGEAEEKAAEAGRKLADGMAEGIDKAKTGYLDAQIEIRKLSGDPAWDLLAQKMELKDAEEGIQNVSRLEKSIADLLQNTEHTSKWNPLAWGDHSDDVNAQAKALQEQMRGKSQSDQAGVAKNALDIQTAVLKNMKAQTDTSAVQLHNQQKYVDFLQQEAELLQWQADSAASQDQAKQQKDRSDKLGKEKAEWEKEQQEWAKHLDEMGAAFRDYRLAAQDANARAKAEKIKSDNEEYEATEAVTKEIIAQDKERAHIAEELGKESAQHTKKMAELTLQSAQIQTKDEAKLKKSHSQQILDEQLAGEQAEYDAQMRAYQIELGSLDKSGKDYEVKLRQIQDREAELVKEHENKVTQIKTQAQTERDARILSAERKMDDELAHGMMQALSGHQSFGKAMIGIGNQVASGMMENAIKSVLANDFTKESDAAAAARKAYLAGMHFPFPVNLVMGPALGAMAFASVMAFEGGGIVPGVEKGDVVPARLTPGEGIMPKKLTEGLTRAAEHGGMDGGGETHLHRHSHQWNIDAFDAHGMDRVLEKHSGVVEKHVENAFRKRGLR